MAEEAPVWLQALTYATNKELQEGGYQVYLKTNLGPPIKVYDAREPAAESGGDGLLKFGVYVVNDKGEEKLEFGGKPETNKILLSSIAAVVVTVGVLLVRGLVRK